MTFDLVAHRGYALRYPENTLPAIEAALAAGARYVEIDVQLSADQVPVLFHDRSLMRMCEVTGALQDFPLAALQTLRAGEPSRFGTRFGTTRLATLAEVVARFEHWPEATLFVEVKRVALERFGADAVYRALEHDLAPIRERAPLISFDLEFLQAARDRGWPALGVVAGQWADLADPRVAAIAPEYVFCDADGLPAAGALAWGEARVAVFEVDDPDVALALAARGVALIETFAFAEMAAAVGGRADG